MMSSNYDQDVLNLFIEETQERLQLMEPLLVELERASSIGTGFPGREALLNELFRHLHSTKGNAGYLGLTELVDLLHAAEYLVDLLRKGAELRPEHVDVLLQSTGVIRSYVAALASGSPESVGPAAERLSHQLRQVAAQGAGEPGVPAGSAASAPAATDTPPALDGLEVFQASTVRVPVAVLDRLGRLAEEMLVTRNRISSLSTSLEHRELIAAAKKLSATVSELQDIAALTRLQPIGSIFAQMHRVVRDAARSTGKDVELLVEGADLEVDRRILQELRDPLVHLLRNAVDHGVELPETRAAAGKPTRGRVLLRADREGSNLVIEVADDGRGIDFEAVRRKAVERGLVPAREAAGLGEEELVKLLLRPGFTTRDEATAVSGRGVGLDVVAVKIQELGGSLEVRSVRGQGTRIRMVVPTSVSVINALVFSTRGYLLGLPYSFVQEIVLIDESQVERYGAQEVFRLRNRLVPLFTLDDWPDRSGRNGAARPTKRHILVLRQGELVAGLWCDGIARFEELIVKPPGPGLREVGTILGLASLGTGEIVLILDPEKLLLSLGLRTDEQRGAETESGSVRTRGEVSRRAETSAGRMALVQGYGEHRYGVPIRLVSRIVRFQPSDLVHVGDQSFLKLDGQLVTLIDLDRALGLGPGQSGSGVGLVLTGDGNPVALSVSRVIRIGPVNGEARPADRRFLTGLLNLDDGVYLLPDVAAIVNNQVRDFFDGAAGAATGAPPSTTRVLIVDDSTFFRDSLEAALRSAGFDVVAVESVEAALERLSADQTISLVITDYMLPGRSGLDLVRGVRAGEERFGRVPILVVSQYLAEAPDLIPRLKEAGADEVVAKFDQLDFRDFLGLVRRLLSRRDGEQAEDMATEPRDGSDGYHVLAVRAGDQVFGFAIERVREIITLDNLTPMPVEKPGFLGLANIRGEIIPVFELRGVLYRGRAEPASDRRTDVVVITGFGPAVLRADGILGTVRGRAEELRAPTGDPGPLGQLIVGVVPLADYLLQVLDLEKLAGVCFGQS